MAVRNFYISTRVDGRATVMGGGPQAKDGGLTAEVLIRDGGSIRPLLTIDGHAHPDGTLCLAVKDESGRVLYEMETQR